MLWGLTGCSGSGATTVAEVWKGLGASVCFLDSVGHGFLQKRTVKAELEKKLGILGLSSMTGTEIRKELRERAFTDPNVLSEINRVVHPRLRSWTAMSSGILRNEKGIFVLDAALIFELGIEEHLDFTVTVSDSRERSLERLQKRDGLSGEAAYGRWNSQIDIQEKCQRSSFVIENSGSLSDLKDNAEYFYINVINKMEDA